MESYDPSAGPYLIGLTGGIATGKSSIFRRLTDMGAYSIDCDKVSVMIPRAYTLGIGGSMHEKKKLDTPN